MSDPFAFVTITDTFQVPTATLVFVYAASVTLSLSCTSIPFISQLTFTVWFTVMLNVLIALSMSFTGDSGAEDIIFGGGGLTHPSGSSKGYLSTESTSVSIFVYDSDPFDGFP